MKLKDRIYMPHEIFTDLRTNLKTSKHQAFAYSYYYYSSYLYRYCRFYKDKKVTQADIKEMLQVSPIEKRVDYIIKKDGVLDQIGYTETTTDYPLSWTLENGYVEFWTVKQHNEQNGINTIITDLNFKVKYPVKCFFRTDETKNKKSLDGTFYETDNTHMIEFEIFEKCMKEDDLGTMGFFIYGFLLDSYGRKANKTKGFALSMRDVKDYIGCSDTTFSKYVKALEEHGLMKIKKFQGSNAYTLANEYKPLVK